MLKLRLVSRSVFVILSAFWRTKTTNRFLCFCQPFGAEKKTNFDLDPFGAFAFSGRQFLLVEV